MTSIGTSFLSKIETAEQMGELLTAMGIDLNKPLIIKPNWVAPIAGEYTEALPLELLFECVKGKKYVVESYTFWRTDLYLKEEKDYFSSSEATLETGKQHWDHFKKQDEWFLDYMKIKPLLEKYNVDYINITDEYWKENCVDSNEIQRLVEAKYKPVRRKEMYSFMPKNLYALKGTQFLSFSHAKAYVIWEATLSTKNLFGLIPAPTRYPLYHAEDNTDVPQNVVDMNKIYRTLFDCYFSVEGITNVITTYRENNRHDVFKDWGYMIGGKNSVEVDHIAAKLIGKNIEDAVINPVRIAEQTFGGFNKEVLKTLPQEAFVQRI